MEEFCEVFKALADPLRLRILGMLPHEDGQRDPPNVSQMARRLGVSQPTVSHHLRVLRQAGLVRARKSRRSVFYRFNQQRLQECAQSMLKAAAEPRVKRRA